MVFSTLRVQGTDFPVDSFLRGRSLEVSAVWHKGEPRRAGRTHEDSGFNLHLPDAESWIAALPTVQAFLESERQTFDSLRSLGVEAVLDIGVTVGEEKSYAPSIEFPRDFLAQLVALGMKLNVSAYPTSEQT
jgi:hypothetical protein